MFGQFCYYTKGTSLTLSFPTWLLLRDKWVDTRVVITYQRLEVSLKFVLHISYLQNQWWLSGLQQLLDHVL